MGVCVLWGPRRDRRQVRKALEYGRGGAIADRSHHDSIRSTSFYTSSFVNSL